jgi:hypothetical protein
MSGTIDEKNMYKILSLDKEVNLLQKVNSKLSDKINMSKIYHPLDDIFHNLSDDIINNIRTNMIDGGFVDFMDDYEVDDYIIRRNVWNAVIKPSEKEVKKLIDNLTMRILKVKEEVYQLVI